MIRIDSNNHSVAFLLSERAKDIRSFIGPYYISAELYDNFNIIRKIRSTLYSDTMDDNTIPRKFKRTKSGFCPDHILLYNLKYNKSIMIDFDNFESIGAK